MVPRWFEVRTLDQTESPVRAFMQSRFRLTSLGSDDPRFRTKRTSIRRDETRQNKNIEPRLHQDRKAPSANQGGQDDAEAAGRQGSDPHRRGPWTRARYSGGLRS